MSESILLTGFRPFDGRGINGAETIARYLHGRKINGHRVESRLINVVWNDVTRFCERSLPTTQAKFVLSLGEADRPWPTFEAVARPHADGADVAGRAAPACPNPDTRDSRLHFETEWFDDLAHAPRLSDDAGAYLCNWMLYHGLIHAAVPMGFLHLPVQGTISSEVYQQRFEPVVRRLIEKNL